MDLGALTLTHFKASKGGTLVGIPGDEETPELNPMTDNGLRDARDREKKYLSELIEKLNDAFGKDISDKDKVAFAVHVSENLRDNTQVMAQVKNAIRDDAMKADLPMAINAAIAGAMLTHQSLATKLLSHEGEPARDLFLAVVYEMLKKDLGGDLLTAARRV